jgi:hypothetical protein
LKICISLCIATTVLSLLISAPMASAQGSQSNATWSEGDTVRIVIDVQKKIGGPTSLGVHGKAIVLKSFAR